MGRGIARQARDKFQGLDLTVENAIRSTSKKANEFQPLDELLAVPTICYNYINYENQVVKLLKN